MVLLVLLVGKHQVYLPEAAPCSQLGFLHSDAWAPEHNTQQTETVRDLCVCVCVPNLFMSSDSDSRLFSLQSKHSSTIENNQFCLHPQNQVLLLIGVS